MAAPPNYAYQNASFAPPPVQVHAFERKKKTKPYVPPPEEPHLDDDAAAGHGGPSHRGVASFDLPLPQVSAFEKKKKKENKPVVPPPEPPDEQPPGGGGVGQPQRELRTSRSTLFPKVVTEAKVVRKVKSRLTLSQKPSDPPPPVPHTYSATMLPPTSVQIHAAQLRHNNSQPSLPNGHTSSPPPPSLPQWRHNSQPVSMTNYSPTPSAYSNTPPQVPSPPAATMSGPWRAYSEPRPPIPTSSPSPSQHSQPTPTQSPPPLASSTLGGIYKPSAGPPRVANPHVPHPTYTDYHRAQSWDAAHPAPAVHPMSAPTSPWQGAGQGTVMKGEYHDAYCEKKTLNGYFCKCSQRLRSQSLWTPPPPT